MARRICILFLPRSHLGIMTANWVLLASYVVREAPSQCCATNIDAPRKSFLASYPRLRHGLTIVVGVISTMGSYVYPDHDSLRVVNRLLV